MTTLPKLLLVGTSVAISGICATAEGGDLPPGIYLLTVEVTVTTSYGSFADWDPALAYLAEDGADKHFKLEVMIDSTSGTLHSNPPLTSGVFNVTSYHIYTEYEGGTYVNLFAPPAPGGVAGSATFTQSSSPPPGSDGFFVECVASSAIIPEQPSPLGAGYVGIGIDHEFSEYLTIDTWGPEPLVAGGLMSGYSSDGKPVQINFESVSGSMRGTPVPGSIGVALTPVLFMLRRRRRHSS